EQIELLSRVILSKKITMGEFDALLGEDPCLVLQLKEENRKVRGKDQPLPALHRWIEKKLIPLFEEATDPKRILQHMAALCSTRVGIAKTVHDIRPPDDILLELNEALDRPAFAQIARKQFQAAIVDEFQDTDPVQWSIFQKLFMAPGKEVPAFYLVGDPKQSIYAFRKADLYTYLNASREMGRENRKMLCTNYRSSKQLIEALNTLFGHQKAGKWLQLPSSTVSIDYQPLLAHLETEPLGDEKKAIHILKIEDPNARSVPSKELEEQVLFPYIASQIKALDLDFSSFAVLIKDRYQAMRLAAFFKRHGVPCVSKSGASVCASKAYLLLDALLPAMIRPNALGAVKRLLSAPIIAWEYPQLLKGSFDDKMQAISTKLHLFKAIWEKDGFAALIEEVLAYGFGHEKSLRELLAIEKENYVDYTHLCELLLEEEGKRPHSCRDLYQVFRQFNQMNPDHHPQLKQREVHESSAVTIMTTHMSKGLEFDVVFALGMACRHSESDNQELEAEKLRLFYVAMTRAKRRVYLPVIRTPGKVSNAASPAEKFFANWEDLEELNSSAISVEVLDCPIKCPGFTPKMEVDIVPPLTYDLGFKRRSISSYSGLVTTTFDTLTPRQSKSFTEFNLHTLPAGSATGTLLHHLLEKVIENGLYQTPTIQGLSAFMQGKLSDLHPWSTVIAELLFQVMHLSIDGVCLKDIPPDAIAQEMEFLLPLQPDLMIKGFADLIFQFGGKTYIVVWKSNWLGPTSDDYSQQNLEKAMEHHDYFLQARIYGAALVQWLRKYETKPPKEFYGGAFYVFLRGLNNEETRGIYHFRNY
ncbi:MAG: UvrD-helicase domain-containing protein, partial [Chlamydiia bacterium]|nr:UvrD-helicase domain-containing protein [Chlamydiia bacterium]